MKKIRISCERKEYKEQIIFKDLNLNFSWIYSRAVIDAFVYNQTELFALLLDYLEPEQLQLTRTYIDRINDHKQSDVSRKQLRLLLRQQTVPWQKKFIWMFHCQICYRVYILFIFYIKFHYYVYIYLIFYFCLV